MVKRYISFITWDQWEASSWPQEGEDIILQRLFEDQVNGLYVDIGAHHPKKFSSTCLFYRLG
jgi:hypothetical protein